MRISRPTIGLPLLSVLLLAACQSAVPGASGGGSSATAGPGVETSTPTAPVTSSPVAPTAPPSPAESIAALSATVVSSTPLDIFPGGPAVGSDALWFWDEGAGQVVRLAVRDGHVAATIPIGDPAKAPYGVPKTVAANGDVVWVTDPSTDAVVRIDPATNKVTTRIALEAIVNATGVDAAVVPFGLAIDGTRLWVSDFDQGVVVQVDPSTRRVTTVVTGIDHPEGLAVGFGSIWVVEHRTGTIARIDRATATVTGRITLPGTGDHPVCGMCVDNVVAGHDSIWVPLDLGHGVVRIDPTTNAVSATIPLSGVAQTLAEGDGAIWTAAWDGTIPCTDERAYVARIDPARNVISGTVVVPCAVTAAVAGGDVWVGTAEARYGVTRLHIQP